MDLRLDKPLENLIDSRRTSKSIHNAYHLESIELYRKWLNEHIDEISRKVQLEIEESKE